MADVKNAPTLYRSKREALGWSREHAAEQIGISDDKLERIENGKQLPNPQDVLLMSDVYQAPELCNYYCNRDCEIGQLYVPKVPQAELPRIILQLLDSVYNVQDIEKKLLETTKYAEFEMHYKTDSALIGGLVIRIGDRVVDSSIRTKLNKLSSELSKLQLKVGECAS